jgi:16S rRNA (adenine1518-N6/adenine1519-N6)-dimethyltransferase
VRRELGTLGIPPLKRFGQHFLIDKSLRDQLIQVAQLTTADTVLEVGPGLGFLTPALAAQAGSVIAIEKDRTLASYLKKKFSGLKNLTVINADVLKTRIPDGAKIVSSPPYNISSKLILLILESRFSLAALLLQKEFAERLTASSGSRDYGRLTVMFQFKGEAKIVEKIPPSAFYPKPKVESVLVTITPRSGPPVVDRELFASMVRALFTQRRRRLKGVLARYLKSGFPDKYEEKLQRIAVPEKRVFETTLQEFANLSNAIAKCLTE